MLFFFIIRNFFFCFNTFFSFCVHYNKCVYNVVHLFSIYMKYISSNIACTLFLVESIIKGFESGCEHCSQGAFTISASALSCSVTSTASKQLQRSTLDYHLHSTSTYMGLAEMKETKLLENENIAQ